MMHQDLLSGFVRVHVLFHAAQHEIHGQWMIGELESHGYRLSPGTLYPKLHSMERKGYLKWCRQRLGKTEQRLYKATPLGRRALKVVRAQLEELQAEPASQRDQRHSRPAPTSTNPITQTRPGRNAVRLKQPARPTQAMAAG